MHPLDVACVAVYFVLVAAVGWWASGKSRDDSRSYFLAGRSVGWMAIGASLFATNISAEHFIGLAGTGSQSGLAVGQFEWLACLILILLGWLFVPLYLRTGVFTMPEFLERRYNRHCRTYLSVVSLAAYVFTKVSVAVYAGALVLKTILGIDIVLGALVLIVATGAYTVFGGLLAVIYTDFLQAGILMAGAALLTALAVGEVGGPAALLARTPPEMLSVWRAADHPEFPWTGILFGAPILGIWYWCTDQVIVQRTLAASDAEEARKACLFAGFLKLVPVFVMVVPGLAGRLLYPEVRPDQLYATMVQQLLPPGVKGVVVAGLLAALMSSLSSVFNSSSTLVVIDFYKQYRPEASEADLVRAGQYATLGLVVVGLAWIPFVGLMSDQLYVYLQSVQAYVSPPIATVFLFGVLWKRATGTGALAALLTGFVVGGARFGLEIAVKAGWVATPALVAFARINFLHFAVLLAGISTVVLVAVSLATPAPDAESLAVTVHGKAPEPGPGSRPSHRTSDGLALMLVGLLGVLWLVFSPWGLGAPRP